MNNVVVLILAAGNSSRMKDKIKQLLPWRNTTLLGNAIIEAKKINPKNIYVVLGANSALIRKSIIEENIIILEHKNWKNGIGSTIAFSVSQISNKNKCDAIFIQLADQPLLNADYLNKMLSLYQRDTQKIVATKYLNNTGVPAIFNKDYFLELSNLVGDTGAKHILKAKNIITINPKEKAVDIDTWEEYERLSNTLK